ncbi:MAG: tetratricopeptide (TPR) repeat protein [Saprospiraceae bacterium]|jgi:tetratricopeptide (TPR) repeat protein
MNMKLQLPAMAHYSVCLRLFRAIASRVFDKKYRLAFGGQLAIVLVCFCLSTALSGQKILHKANKQFDLKHYHEAIDSYKKTLDKHPENLQAKSNLAEAYRMTNQLGLAEEAYTNIMLEEFLDPIHIRNYGITLMKMAKYTEAHYQFELYKIYNPQDAQHYQLSCEFAHHLYRQNDAYEVELVGVNTANSDFGVAFADDRLIFSSFRNDVELSKDAKMSGQKLTGNMLYVAEVTDDLRAKNVQFLRSGIAEKKNIGPISFAPQVGKCAFTRNKIQNGGAHVTGDDSYHSIYIADLKENGDWNNERPFRYNEFGTSTGFPSLAFDGSALYFASNRVGGFGGYDVYVSYWKDNSWTYPENLGSDVNTAGNEITPFFNGEDLYFASDFHHGMGGYDIFHSLVKGGQWTHPENMANGINSPADDYYPMTKEGSEGIFFSSNRLGGKGMDDIYLAVPLEIADFVEGSDFVPNAVALATMQSDVSFDSYNPSAKAVANTDEMQITVLNPAKLEEVENTDPKVNELSSTIIVKEEEELITWGFAKPNEEIVQDAKVDIVINQLPIHELGNISSSNTKGVTIAYDVSIPIKILGSSLDKFIAEIEEEELAMELGTGNAIETEPIVEEVTIETKVKAVPQTIEPQTTPEEIVEQTIISATVVVAEKPESFKIPNYKAISASRAPLNLDLAGAKRVALGEILPASNVYFIQLAALSKTSGNVNKFLSLSKFGNLYKVFKSTSTKIKLGYFLDKQEAQSVLKSVKSSGYKDAFITKDDLGSLQIELIVANDSQKDLYTSYDSSIKASTKKAVAPETNNIASNEFSLNNTGRNSYKIRLASYEDPIWFDIEKAKQLGKIEQWTKGAWTIFILGGYSSYADAEQAMIKAVNKGFADAEIVIDNNGILERLKQN